MLKIRKFSLKIFVGIFSLTAASAFGFHVSVKSLTTASQVFVGDRFDYEISVTAPESAMVDLPSFVGNLGNFEVKDLQHEERSDGAPKGQKKFVWRATLNTFVAGDFLIAPQEVRAVLGADSVVTRTDPVAVKVVSRTDGSEEDILDVEEPLADTRLPGWVSVLLGIVAAALLVFLGWFLHKKFRREKVAPKLPPYEEAVLALKELRDKQLLALGNQAEFYAALSFIVRRYVERRFLGEHPAEGILDATLSQLKVRVPQIAELPEEYRAALVEFERETYPVKFAKMKIGDDRGLFWDDWAGKLFEETKPAPESEKKENANGSR